MHRIIIIGPIEGMNKLSENIAWKHIIYLCEMEKKIHERIQRIQRHAQRRISQASDD